MIRRLTNPREHHLGNLDPEPIGRLTGFAIDLDSSAADLGIAQPGTRILRGRIVGRRMDHHSRIAPKVGRFDRAGHHPHHRVAIDKRELDPADPGRAIPVQGRQRLVAAQVKNPLDAGSEIRLGGDQSGPGARIRTYT